MITPDNISLPYDTITDTVVRFHVNVNVTTTNRDPVIASVTLLARDRLSRPESPHSLVGYSALDCPASTLLCELLLDNDCARRTVDYMLAPRATQIVALLNIVPDDNLAAVITQTAITYVGADPLTFTREISVGGDDLPVCINRSVYKLFQNLVNFGPNERVVRALRERGTIHKHVASNVLRYMSCLEH